jgi:hypothetical protein
MLKRRIIVLSLLSLIITCLSPFMFAAYFEKKPTSITQTAKFGGPFPFVQQTIVLPDNPNKYPIEVNFIFPPQKETKMDFVPFFLSFISFFTIIYTLAFLGLLFFNGPKKVPDDRL